MNIFINMRYAQLKLSVFLFLGLVLTKSQAQTMLVNESSQTQTAYALNSLQKMSFSFGNLTLTKIDNSSDVYALSDLKFLNFSDIITDLNEPFSIQRQISGIYPNPINNTLNIDFAGIDKTEVTVSILNFEGKTVFNQLVSIGGVVSLDISHLPAGIYLCHLINSTEVTTVKIIKE